MPKKEFEIIVVDSRSTEDIKKVFEPYIGKMNIRHIKIDPTQNQIYKEMNEGEEAENYKKKYKVKENWYHTPALAINIGIKQARGDILCITQPEIIHNPESFIHGYNNANSSYGQVFGEIIMVSSQFQQWLDENKNWADMKFENVFDAAYNAGREYEFVAGEYYWFVEYLPRDAALKIGGVDEEYLRGVYGEDDNFRIRGRMAVRDEIYRGRTGGMQDVRDCIVGLHQSHREEAGKIENQNRESAHWNYGANVNRARLDVFCKDPQMIANQGKDWGSDKCVKEIVDYAL